MVSTRSSTRSAAAAAAPDAQPVDQASETPLRNPRSATRTPRQKRARSRPASSAKKQLNESDVVVIDDDSDLESVPSQAVDKQLPHEKDAPEKKGQPSSAQVEDGSAPSAPVEEKQKDVQKPEAEPGDGADGKGSKCVGGETEKSSTGGNDAHQELQQSASAKVKGLKQSSNPAKDNAKDLPADSNQAAGEQQKSQTPAEKPSEKQTLVKEACLSPSGEGNASPMTRKDSPSKQNITENDGAKKSAPQKTQQETNDTLHLNGDTEAKVEAKDKSDKTNAGKPGNMESQTVAPEDNESRLASMDPASFLRRNQDTSQFCRELIRESYNQQSEIEFGSNLPKYYIAPQRRGKKRPPLGPLVTLETGEHFDSDQLWEEMELRNKPLIAFLHRRLTGIKNKGNTDRTKKGVKAVNEKTPNTTENEELNSDDRMTTEKEAHNDDLPDENDGEDSDVPNSDGESSSTAPSDGASPKRRVRFAPDTKELHDEKEDPEKPSDQNGTSIEDGFFSIADMEMFADDAEQLALAGKLIESDDDDGEGGSDDEESDGEDDENDEDEEMATGTGGENPRYADFFDPPEGRKLHDAAGKGYRVSALLGADDEDVDSDAVQTPFAASQARTRKMIEAIEEENVGKKPWQLRGEVTGHSRPKDSLLDANMDHDTSGKVGLITDEDRNETIEDIIRQRIVDQLFDDVVPAFPENYQADQNNKRKEIPEVSQEKSKESLADIYAREYLGEKEKARGEKKSEEVKKDEQDAENDEQREVNKLYAKLAVKLDALSALHFTPPAPKESDEMVVSKDVKAISFEEAIPEGVSDGNVLAPKQVYSVNTNSLVGEKEKTKDERRAARGRSKSARRKRNQAKERAAQLMAQANPAQAEKRKAEEALLRRGKKIKVAEKDGFKSRNAMRLKETPKKANKKSIPDEAMGMKPAKPSASSLVL